MHARLVTFRVREGNLDQVIRIIRHAIIPAASRQPGFNGLVLISNPETSKAMTTTYWESEADMLASEDAEYFQEQISRVIALLRGPPQIEHYRVDAIS